MVVEFGSYFKERYVVCIVERFYFFFLVIVYGFLVVWLIVYVGYYVGKLFVYLFNDFIGIVYRVEVYYLIDEFLVSFGVKVFVYYIVIVEFVFE